MSNKKDLRLKLKTILSLVSDSDHHQLSKQVSLKLKEFLNGQGVIQNKLVLGVFAPIHKEPDWSLEVEEAKMKTAYPAYANNLMVFKLARMSELLISQDFGVAIKGPEQNAQIVAPDIVIVPGLGFTKDGKRLGRGKGFYDRYLKNSNAVKVGLAFDLQIEADIPTEDHDELMDFVITDKDIYKNS